MRAGRQMNHGTQAAAPSDALRLVQASREGTHRPATRIICKSLLGPGEGAQGVYRRACRKPCRRRQQRQDLLGFQVLLAEELIAQLARLTEPVIKSE